MVFRLSWLGAPTEATGGKVAEECFIYLPRGLLLIVRYYSGEQFMYTTLIKRELDIKLKWDEIVCFKQLFKVRRRVSNASCVLECRIFLFIWLSMTLMCLRALQRTLLKAAQPPAFPLRSVFLTWHSFHLVLFPKYVYANIQGTQQVLLLK